MFKPLTDSQKKQLKEHQKHHTPKHIKVMRATMMLGVSFQKAHDHAMKKVGQ